LDIKEAACESLKENEKTPIGNWKKENLCSVVAKKKKIKLTTLLPLIMWKVERVPERGNTVKEISSQDVGNYF
jgi:hypothetical protein